MKKILALLLVLALMLGMVACGNKTEEEESNKNSNVSTDGNDSADAVVPDYINTESQFPIVKEGTDITLEVMIVNGPMYSNMDSLHEVYFIDAYEKMTGVHIEWVEVSSDAFEDQLALSTGGDFAALTRDYLDTYILN